MLSKLHCSTFGAYDHLCASWHDIQIPVSMCHLDRLKVYRVRSMEWTPQIIIDRSWSELYLRNTKLGGTTIRIDNHIPSQTWSRSNVTLHHLEPPKSEFPHSLTPPSISPLWNLFSVDLFVFPRKTLLPFTIYHPWLCFTASRTSCCLLNYCLDLPPPLQGGVTL